MTVSPTARWWSRMRLGCGPPWPPRTTLCWRCRTLQGTHHTLGQKPSPKTHSLSLPWEVKLMMASNAELHSFICLFSLWI